MTGTSDSAARGFRQRFIGGERLLGTFVKIPSPQPVEILGEAGFDFLVIDEEHAPFDRQTIDIAILAARAAGTAPLVRVSSVATILSALDCGADGILVPHVSDVKKAKEVVAASRYRGGRRGYSPSGRSGRYGGSASWPYIDAQDAKVTVIAMIEDPPAVESMAEIAAVEGIDGFFIGRGDLSVALGARGSRAPEVNDAVKAICDAAKAAGKPVMVMANTREEGDGFAAMGAASFILSTDQGLLRKAAGQILKDFGA